MTQFVLYTSKHAQAEVQRKATDKESLTVKTRNVGEASVYATLDHFRGITKLIGLGNVRRSAP